MKRYFRNIIAMLLAAVFIMSAVPAGAVTVHPLDSMNVVTLTIPTESEANPNGWGRPDLEFMGGWVHNGSWRKVVYCRDSRIGQVVYCIEPGRPIDADTQYGDHDESYWENHPGNDTIDADTVKKHIGRILAYGYLGNGNPEWNSANSAHAAQMANAIATQLLVWEVIVGERDADFAHIDATQYGKNNVIEEVMEENPIRQQILSVYNSIVSSVRDHLTLPSFCTSDASDADPFNMEWNGSAWVIELTDANNVLSDYEFTGNVSGMTFTKSGNKLTVTSPAMPEGEVQINASRIGSERRGVITWTGGNNQTTVSYGATVSDPVNGCFKLIRSGVGSLHLVKTAEDGNIAGIGFTIEGQGQSIHRVTDANGIIDISTLVPGTYTVTEDESELYAPQAPQTVTIVSGETATVTFHNTLRKGGLHLVKTSEDGNVSGIGFTISGNGKSIHRITDDNGVIDVNDLLPGVYTVTEDESELYAPQPPQTVTIVSGETATVSFYNTIRRGGLHLAKTAEDGNVSGIGFTISGNGVNVHRVTDANGVIDIADLQPGTYTVTEDESELYAPQPPQTVTIVSGETATVTFHNTLRKGGLHLVKTSEDGNVSGIGFTISGNGVNVHRVTDANGVIDIADLQPGTYTVTEDESEFYAPQAPQTVTVSYGETATVSFYNTIRRGGLHLVKTAEDGNVSGIGFTISGNGKSIHRITDDNGVIDVNDLLPGVYTVTEDGSDLYEPQEPKTVTVSYGETATVTFRNILRRGALKVTKTAEDGLVEGLIFHLYGTADCGLPVDEYAVTNEKGIAVFENVLIGSGYILEEVDTPDQYVVPDSQTAVIEWNEVSGHNFENKLKRGGLHLVKTAEDGNVAGIGFTIEGNGISIHRFTDENGVIDIDGLLPGVYTVTEDASELYAPQDSQTVTVVADKTSTVTFNNTLRRGALKVTKTAEDGLVEGLTFHLYGTSDCGLPVDEYAVTNEKGIAVFENVLIGSGYILEEVGTPDQYVVPDDQTAVIEWNEVSGHNFENKLKRGSIKGYKLDRETGKPILGALFGLFAEDEVDFIEANALMLAKSDDEGVFLFENIICGSYLVCELIPAEGYLANDTVYPVTVDDNGAVIEIEVYNDMIPEISTNAKIDGEKDACATDVLVLVDTVEYKHLVPGREYTLRGVLMDKFTGEAFTENGEKIVSEVSFIPEAPCGSIDMLFTFDARLIKAETRIVVFECLYSDGVLLASHEDINDSDQTVTVLIPRILTEASIDGQKEAFNTGTIKIEDKVSYFNLTPGREYTLRGRLMDKSTGRPFNVNGRPVTAHTTFTPDARNGEVILTFAVPSECFTATTDLVVFERLYRENTEIASHEDIEDESQTVRVYFPKVWTTATIDGQKEAFNTGIITVEDKVFFEGLIPGREYTVRGVLMDKATGEPFMVDGEPVSTEVAFVAEASSGEITLTFPVPSEYFDETTDLVAFERLFYGETEIASHEDIEDESQTVRVYFPKVWTTATIDGQKEAFNTGIITVEDKVFFEGLIINREYTVRGVLMDKATGEPFMVDGEPVSAEVTFVAEASNGEITLSFTVPSEYFDDTTDLVAFERLFCGETEIASHEDIEDESQTVRVYVPSITTTATIDGQKEAFNTGIITVEDKVFFEGLIIGREYTVRGVLMNKATGEPFTVDGEPVSAEVTFVAEASSGEITLTFTVPSECFDDTTDLVAFERLFYGETEIASHEDIDDESQTVRVYFPKVWTTATIDGQKEAFNTGIITVEDKVFFEGLIIGREYTVRGVLMDKATGEPFMVDGEPISAEVTFVAEASDGEVVLTFTFDARLLTEETQLVAFERLFCGETVIASHEDIEDEDQTVTVKPKPDIPKTDDTDEPDNIGVWIGLCAIALGGAVACVLLYFKNKKNGGEK